MSFPLASLVTAATKNATLEELSRPVTVALVEVVVTTCPKALALAWVAFMALLLVTKEASLACMK